MIRFEIIKSPDPFVLGSQTYYRNYLSVGKGLSDINIFDEKINSPHIVFEISSSFLFIHLASSVDAILINKKRVTKTKKISKDEIISIGESEIKILDFSLTGYESQKLTILKNLQQIEKDPSLTEIKEIIEKTKKYLGHLHEF